MRVTASALPAERPLSKAERWVRRMLAEGRCRTCGSDQLATSRRDGHTIQRCRRCADQAQDRVRERIGEEQARLERLGVWRARDRPRRVPPPRAVPVPGPLRAHDYPQYVPAAREYVAQRVGNWRRRRT